MENISHLQSGKILQNGKYRIEKKLSQGGFGITYLAYYNDMQTQVAIKECFLSGCCVRQTDNNSITLQSLTFQDYRDFITKFKQEAQTLFQFRTHHNIVHVIDVFEENNTAYYVMDYLEGETLAQLIKRKGKLSYEEAMNFIGQLCDATEGAHSKGIIHRDIKPDNIMITTDNKAVLIDFGTAKELIQCKTRSTQAILTPGYAPEEQYSTKREKGKYTDIYAIGATLYYCLTGEVPTESIDRRSIIMPEPKMLNTAIPNNVNRAILKAMELNHTDRYQTVDAFLSDMLKTDDSPTPQPTEDISQNTNKAINSRQIEIFVKEKQGIWKSSEWYSFIVSLEKQFGKIDEDKIKKIAFDEKAKIKTPEPIKEPNNNLRKTLLWILAVFVAVVLLFVIFNNNAGKKQVDIPVSTAIVDSLKADSLKKDSAAKVLVVDSAAKVAQSEPASTTVTDIDGNVYKTIKIGNQVWMAENLKTTHYRDGSDIPNVTDNNEWSKLTTAAYCNYDNSTSKGNTYGCLYNWYAVNDYRGLAPDGWHIPSDAEWTTLSNFLGGSEIAGGKLKSTKSWDSPNTGASNSSGFTALPGGFRDYDGAFGNIGLGGYWWSSTEYGTSSAWGRSLVCNNSGEGRGGNSKNNGFSVRCLRDF